MMRRIVPVVFLFALLAACSQAPDPTTPLRVVGLSPAAGAADVPLDASITVRFDGDVDESLLHDSVLALQAGSAAVDGELAYDDAANTLRFRPGALLQAATTYSVVLSSDVRSADGGVLQLSSDWSFTTVAAEPADPVDDATRDVDEDGIPDGEDVDVDVPGVESVSPASWSIADRSTDIRVRFDEPIDPATFDPGTIRVYSGFVSGFLEVFVFEGPGIDGTFAYDEATQEAVFTPAAPLKADEWHWVVLDLDVADLAGNVFTGEGTWLFATER